MSDQVSPEYFKVVRDVLEVVSFAATPIIAWLAWKGLKQIKVTKDIAKVQAQRESFRLATEKCEHFAKEVFAANSEVAKLFDQKKFVEFSKVKVNEDDKTISIDWTDCPKWFEEIGKNGKPIFELANLLEGFSMWFTCRIADEGIAFRPCGVSFCTIVRKILPLLVLANQRDKTFSHTLRLYTAWRNKIALEENFARQQELEKQRRTLKVENIKPIGT